MSHTGALPRCWKCLLAGHSCACQPNAPISIPQVRLADGEVCDRFVVEDDFVQLSHAHGAHLLGDRLAILALRSQQHHLLQARRGVGVMSVTQ